MRVLVMAVAHKCRGARGRALKRVALAWRRFFVWAFACLSCWKESLKQDAKFRVQRRKRDLFGGRFGCGLEQSETVTPTIFFAASTTSRPESKFQRRHWCLCRHYSHHGLGHHRHHHQNSFVWHCKLSRIVQQWGNDNDTSSKYHDNILGNLHSKCNVCMTAYFGCCSKMQLKHISPFRPIWVKVSAQTQNSSEQKAHWKWSFYCKSESGFCHYHSMPSTEVDFLQKPLKAFNVPWSCCYVVEAVAVTPWHDTDVEIPLCELERSTFRRRYATSFCCYSASCPVAFQR